MSFKALSIAAILLAVVTAVGFGYEQPLIGLGALVFLVGIGVYTLYKLSLDDAAGAKRRRKGQGKKRSR